MTYLIQPLLYHLGGEILRGLADQSLVRWGGVIRRAAGHPGAGQIVAHLRDVGMSTQVHAALGTVLQVGQVAAAASVLNLGVTAVGFAIMAKKLDRLQADVLTMMRSLDGNHVEVMGALASVQSSLVELKYLELQGHDLVREAIAEVRRTRQDLLNGYVARMLVEYEVLRSDTATTANLEAAKKTFSEARRWLELGIDGESPSAATSERWLDVLVRFRAWCFAVVGEMASNRKLRARREALDIATLAAQKARDWTTRWTSVLAPPSELEGLHRFSFSAFREIPDETRLRLRRLEAGSPDVTLRTTDRDLAGARAVAHALPALPPRWTETQMALASTLDFVEEVVERLDGVREEMALCERQRLAFEEWEGLLGVASESGVSLIVI